MNAFALPNHNSPAGGTKRGFTAFDNRPIFNDGMSKWVRIAGVDDCPRGTGIECLAAGRIVALFNLDGNYFAIDGVCAHQGGPLARGLVAGTIVACPWHGWQYDVTTGQHKTNRTISQATFPVLVEGNDILIDMEDRP